MTTDDERRILAHAYAVGRAVELWLERECADLVRRVERLERLAAELGDDDGPEIGTTH